MPNLAGFSSHGALLRPDDEVRKTVIQAFDRLPVHRSRRDIVCGLLDLIIEALHQWLKMGCEFRYPCDGGRSTHEESLTRERLAQQESLGRSPRPSCALQKYSRAKNCCCSGGDGDLCDSEELLDWH